MCCQWPVIDRAILHVRCQREILQEKSKPSESLEKHSHRNSKNTYLFAIRTLLHRSWCRQNYEIIVFSNAWMLHHPQSVKPTFSRLINLILDLARVGVLIFVWEHDLLSSHMIRNCVVLTPKAFMQNPFVCVIDYRHCIQCGFAACPIPRSEK